MTIRDAVLYATNRIKEAEIENPTLDTIVLLCHSLNITKEKLFSIYSEEMDNAAFNNFKNLVNKRCSHCPVAYLTGSREFFGLDFYVNEHTLIPRPDTEILVEKAIDIIDKKPDIKTVHDLCTGSGCIIISIKNEKKHIKASASDISHEAEKIFRKNKEKHKADVDFYLSDLFENIDTKFDMIVTNPPYVKDSEVDTMQTEGSREPELALRGGDIGIEFPVKVIKKALSYLNPGAYLILEAGFDQHEILKKEMESCGYTDIEISRDLAGRNRVISGRVK